MVKTAVSVPDSLFRSADELAERLRLSRSEVYSRALAAYLERYENDLITRRLNEIHGPADDVSSLDPVLATLQYRAIAKSRR